MPDLRTSTHLVPVLVAEGSVEELLVHGDAGGGHGHAARPRPAAVVLGRVLRRHTVMRRAGHCRPRAKVCMLVTGGTAPGGMQRRFCAYLYTAAKEVPW